MDVQQVAEDYDAVLLWECTGATKQQFMAYGFSTAFERGRLTVLARNRQQAQVGAVQ
jgi:hypothetical protein